MRLAPRRALEHALTSVLAVRWSSAHKQVKVVDSGFFLEGRV